MNRTDFWKNFHLGEELSISGTFIYNGLRRFHELQKLAHTDEIFEVLYHLSIGLERLMKIVIVLLEHDENMDQEAFEASLITHSHLDLLARIKKHRAISIGPTHNQFLALLSRFYKTLRYDRFSLSSAGHLGKERDELLEFFAKNLDTSFSSDSVFGNYNEDKFRNLYGRLYLR